jgi:hypothetical protein
MDWTPTRSIQVAALRGTHCTAVFVVDAYTLQIEDLEISVSILGLNAFHGDSSAALVRDGEPIAAAEEG